MEMKGRKYVFMNEKLKYLSNNSYCDGRMYLLIGYYFLPHFWSSRQLNLRSMFLGVLICISVNKYVKVRVYFCHIIYRMFMDLNKVSDH